MLTFRFSGADGIMEEKEILTAGMVRKKVKLVFSSDWYNMTKTVVFTAGSVTRAVVGVSDVAEIPAEVLATPLEDLYVGVYGISMDGTVTPTIRVKGPEILPGTEPAHDEGTNPDLAVWAQLLGMIGNLQELDTEAKDNLVAAINEVLAESGSAGTEIRLEYGVSKDKNSEPTTWSEDIPAIDAVSKYLWANIFIRNGNQVTIKSGIIGAYGDTPDLSDCVKRVNGVKPDPLTGNVVVNTPEYTLPVAGENLGGVKNGGNVVINEDGTMTAPGAGQNPTGDGLNATATALLISILRNAVYSTDQSASITALESALLSGGSGGGSGDDSGSGEEEGGETVTTCSIVSALLHVTSNNASASVESGASYTAAITAEDGYTLDGATVSVTMGGLDITPTAYANGVVHIASVTGNVIISVTAAAAVQSDILYQLESPLVCTADGSDPIDTELKISDSDKDFSYCTKITCAAHSTLTRIVGDSFYSAGFNFYVGSTYTRLFGLYIMGGSAGFSDDWRMPAEGQSMIVITHAAGSGEYKWKMVFPTREGRESYSPTSGTVSKAFVAYDENTVKIAKGAFTGSLDDLVIYNRVLTDDEITAYLGV